MAPARGLSRLRTSSECACYHAYYAHARGRLASGHFGALRAHRPGVCLRALSHARTRKCGAPARGCSDVPRRAPARSYSKSSSRYAGLNLEVGGGSHASPEVALLPTIDRKATQKRLACAVAARGYVSRRGGRGGTAGRGAHRGGEGDAVSLRDEREVCEVDEGPHSVRGHDRREPAAAERAADASDAASAEERVRRQIHEDDRRAP